MKKFYFINKNNIWNYYSKSFAKVTPSFSKELLKFAGDKAFGDILDSGCGPGKLIDYLNFNKVKSITMMEHNREMILEANKKIKSIKNKISINLINCDIEKSNNFNQKYDTIISLNVLYTLNNPKKYLKNIFKKLKKEGKLILSTPSKKLNIKSLEKIGNIEYLNSYDYELVKYCNYFLSSNKFEPKLFSKNELENILIQSNIKFDEIYEKHYDNQNLSVICYK